VTNRTNPTTSVGSANPLLDPPAIMPARLARLEGDIASLLETQLDVVLPQAEAVLPLEAAARGLGRAGLTALNLDTSPYGVAFGRWLREAGASVVGVAPEPREAVKPEAVERALREHPDISVVSFVHVEAASGIRNDAAAISALAGEHGALVVIDVVASIGAHEVRLDAWGADVAVIGPQKALAGPAGISIAAVSGRAWKAMSENPGAPRLSLLSLLDWKERWLDSDKSAIPGTPAPLEIIALEAAIERVSAEGLRHLQRRHEASAAASRRGARVLGLTPFASDADAAVVATTLRSPADTDARSLVERARANRQVALSPGFGELAATVVRIDHTGQRARLSVVLEALEALGRSLEGSAQLRGSIADALEAAEQAWVAEMTRASA
jgi:aspartate aminotransferase-like enzyme